MKIKEKIITLSTIFKKLYMFKICEIFTLYFILLSFIRLTSRLGILSNRLEQQAQYFSLKLPKFSIF